MKTKKQYPKTRFAVIFGVMLILTLTGLLFGLAWPSMQQVQAGPTLPPRDPPTPIRPSEPNGDDGKDSGPVGAYIELQAQNASAGAWSVVQWQDSARGWHDVAGWRGTPDERGHRRWWVHPKDFGTGPFRWVVYRSPGGSVIATSVPFNLPAEANQTVRVEVLVR